MNSNNNPTQYALPAWLRMASIAGIVIGIIGIGLGFRMASPDTWLWLLVGFVFFAGLAHGTLAWVAAFRVAQTRWAPAVNRLGHSLIAFLPVIAIALIILLAGVRHWVPWIAHPVPAKAGWLNVPFMVARDLVSVGVLYILFFLLVRWSLAADSEGGLTGITERDHFRLTAVATTAVMMYTVTGSIIAYDFIMSLLPTWYSTMFAPYIWITNAYSGMALLVLMATMLRKPLRVEQYLGPQQFQDMGNLMLGFSLFSMGLFFAQYLTIWYENLPEETPFLIIRYLRGPWPYLGWASFILAYGIPFILLQSRHLKRNPAWLWPVAVMAIVGVALERYVLVVPSILPAKLMLNPLGGLVLLAFLGAMVLSVAAFVRRYSPVSSADEALRTATPGVGAVT